ncbi:MAG: polysaccharide deacetylase family protein [Myxococcales bacterium]|nr:polysaccharide deacetylase family protein [Myxococcales bacterium]MCB9531955.1 polysaccharide deacetylase family protein [Myxococcales bacterium]MCB9532832.1 polysaccharide deacetylase family protein [Myxococcales bacterium]
MRADNLEVTTSGVLCISLDFELYWGMRDVVSLDDYRAHLDGVPASVAATLDVFAAYGVHATWATVGLVDCRDPADARALAPDPRPQHSDPAMDNLAVLDAIEDPSLHRYYFAPELVDAICATPGQELATHTFSHMYPLEGASLESFRADLSAACAAAARRGRRLRSIVFPRNQYTAAHVAVAAELGIDVHRGNPPGWMYAPRTNAAQSAPIRLARLLDAHVPVVETTAPLTGVGVGVGANVPASRLLRPGHGDFAHHARLNRVRDELRLAAHRDRMCHLWWHPHNFGVDLDANLAGLIRILDEFASLRAADGMRSLTMAEVADAYA